MPSTPPVPVHSGRMSPTSYSSLAQPQMEQTSFTTALELVVAAVTISGTLLCSAFSKTLISSSKFREWALPIQTRQW